MVVIALISAIGGGGEWGLWGVGPGARAGLGRKFGREATVCVEWADMGRNEGEKCARLDS